MLASPAHGGPLSLQRALDAADDVRRLEAIYDAGKHGDLRIVDTLLDIALHDSAEVKVIGGMAEMYEELSTQAAIALTNVFARHGFHEPRIREAALDPAHDDDRVATLLYCLGPFADVIRQELGQHADERIRLRALKSVLSIERTREASEDRLLDPSAVIRIEALQGNLSFESRLRVLRDDPVPAVRIAAAMSVRFSPAESRSIIAALGVERDPGVRTALAECLLYRWRDGAFVARAMLPFIDDETEATRLIVARGLKASDLPDVGSAMAARCDVEPSDRVLGEVLEYRFFPQYAPHLKERFAEIITWPRQRALRTRASSALKRYGAEAIPLALRLVDHDDDEVRSQGWYLACELADADTCDLLEALVSHPRHAAQVKLNTYRLERARDRLDRAAAD